MTATDPGSAAAPARRRRARQAVSGRPRPVRHPRRGSRSRGRLVHPRTGETLAVVGESGCGKSTLARCVLRLLTPTAGRIVFDGIDITDAIGTGASTARRNAAMVFQDPFGSLNPRRRVGSIIGEPFREARFSPDATKAARPGAVRPGRPEPRALQPLPARVLRRPATADRDRPGARAASEADRLRRAGLGARRLSPGADPEPARRPSRSAPARLLVHHPQPRHRQAILRPGAGHVSRPSG